MVDQQQDCLIKSPVAGNITRNGRWDTGDLIRRCCNALDTASETITLLAAQGFKDTDDVNNHILPEKIIGETGLLLLVTSIVGSYKEIADRVEAIAGQLIPYARKEKTFLDICLQPALAMEYAMAHIFLTNIGHPDPKFDALLLKSINALSHYGRERPPHRMMEQAWMKKIWNGNTKSNNYHFSKTMADSVLNKPIDLLHGTRDDMYAFTHSLMYATDFHRSPGKLPRRRAEILSEAEAMLARSLDEEDYDLAGEVLLTWPLTGKSWSAAAAFAFRILAKAEDEAGFLPSLSTNKATLQKLEGDDRKKYLYASAYHTAYVMGLLCAVSLQPGKTPPKYIRTKTLVPGSSQKILPFLGHDEQKKQWRDEFDKLTEREQDTLSGFLLNVALIKNVRQKQYGTVYELLSTAYQMGMADTALASQSAELLDRLSMVSQG
jgi:hypothetical protein